MEEIYLLSDEEISEKYEASVQGTIVSCIKHIRRYGMQSLPKEIWLKILFYAHKGVSCKDDHLDITQRKAIFEYLEDKNDITDPHLLQFIKECKEKHQC